MNDKPLPIANARALIDVFHRHEQFHKDVQTSMEVFDTFQPEGARKSEWVERRIYLEMDTTNNRDISRLTIDIRERTQRKRMLVLDEVSNIRIELGCMVVKAKPYEFRIEVKDEEDDVQNDGKVRFLQRVGGGREQGGYAERLDKIEGIRE